MQFYHTSPVLILPYAYSNMATTLPMPTILTDGVGRQEDEPLRGYLQLPVTGEGVARLG